MTGKIFRSTLAASLTVLLASLLVITGCLYTYFGTVREQQLQTELTLAAAAVEADGADYLARVRDTAERLTWVASDGAVLYDTRTDTQPMENHGQREEIREALTGGSGSSARYSETLTEKMLYQAVRLTDGSVLRISGSQKTVWMLVLGMLHAVIVVALLAVGLSALLASRAARRVVEPLNRLDLEHLLVSRADRPKVIRLTGGVAKSKVWTQIFADVMNLPIEIVDVNETGALGCAIAAATATGEYRDMKEAASKMSRITTRVEPIPENVAIYNKKYDLYRKTADALNSVWDVYQDLEDNGL